MVKSTQRFLLSALLLINLIILSAHAVPAYPGKVVYTQPDGSTLAVKLHGDEYFNYTTLENGATAQLAPDGYYYYTSISMQGVQRSSVRVADATGATKSAPMAFSNAPDPMVINYLRSQSPLLTNRALLQTKAPMQSNPLGAPLSKAQQSEMPSFYLTKPLVILVEYSDIKMTTSNAKQVFYNHLNHSGSAPLGSVKTYYNDNSKGLYNPTFDVEGVVTVKNKSEYYAGADGTERVYEMIEEACKQLVAKGVDLKQYDQNKDGVLDNVMMIFAGYNQAQGAPANTVWPHKWDVRVKKNLSVGGVIIGPYSCSSEFKGYTGAQIDGIGTFTHEFGHVLGLPDYYDTNGAANGACIELESLSLMSSGSYNNGSKTPPYLSAQDRIMLGWLTPEVITSTRSLSLQPINESNQAYIINTQVKDEYFLIESRNSANGWDRYIDNSGGNSAGLVVYHVDQSNNIILNGVTAADLWSDKYHMINAVAGHPCMYYFASSQRSNLYSQVFYPGVANNTMLGNSSSPQALSWAKQALPLELANIKWDGSKSTFDVVGKSEAYAVRGRVLDKNNKPVVGANVKLTGISSREASQTKGTQQGLTFMPFENMYSKTAPSLSVVTNDYGYFIFGTVPDGKYIATVVKYGFVESSVEITVNGNDVDISQTPIVMETTENQLEKRISHAKLPVSGLISVRSATGVVVSWSPEMLQNLGVVGKPLKTIFWNTPMSNLKASVKVYFDTSVAATASMLVKGGYNFVAMETDLIIPANKSLRIEITFPTSANFLSAVCDGGTKGYGDIIIIGSQLVSLVENGFDLNLDMGFSVSKESQELDKPVVRTSGIRQYSATFEWGSYDLNVTKWGVSLTEEGANAQTREIENANKINYTKLKPGTKYVFTVKAMQGSLEEKETSVEFTTKSVTAPHSALEIEKIQGNTYALTFVNTKEHPASCTLQVNGQPQKFTTDGFMASLELKSGDEVKFTLTYADGTSEIITKFIK